MAIAEVEVEPAEQLSANAGGRRIILDIAAKARRKTAGEDLDEAEAIAVGLNLREDRRIGQQSAACGKRNTCRTIAAVLDAEIADEHRGHTARFGCQRLAGCGIDGRTGIHAAAIGRIAEEEPAVDVARCVGPEGIEADFRSEIHAHVGDELDVVIYVRLAPDLRRVGDGRIACRDQRRRIVALDGADGGVGLAIFARQIDEATAAEADTDIGTDRVLVAVAFVGLPPLRREGSAVGRVLEDEIQHTRNGVRSILRGCAVTQHFELLDGDCGDDGDVGALRAVRNAAAQKGDHGGAVHALAIDEDQRVIRRQTAKVCRPHERGRIRNRLRSHVEGWHRHTQHIADVAIGRVVEFGRADNVHRSHGIGCRTVGLTRARHDDGRRIGFGNGFGIGFDARFLILRAGGHCYGQTCDTGQEQWPRNRFQ